MPEQLSLAGFDAESRLTDRLFLAIRPDVGAARRDVQCGWYLRDAPGLGGEPLAMERLHVTLYRLVDNEGLPRGIVAAAREAAAIIAMPPFDRAMSFYGRPGILPSVLCGDDGVAGLMILQRLLGTALKKAGLERWVETQHTPHMILLCDSHRVAGQDVEAMGWTAHEFVLIHSLLGRTLHSVRAVAAARLALAGMLKGCARSS